MNFISNNYLDFTGPWLPLLFKTSPYNSRHKKNTSGPGCNGLKIKNSTKHFLN